MTKEKSVKGIFRLKAIGDSLFILVDKDKRTYLEAQEGDFVMARISKIKEKVVNCPKCKYEVMGFENDDVFDCPNCGAEFTEAETNNNTSENKDLVEGNDDMGELKGGQEEQNGKTI